MQFSVKEYLTQRYRNLRRTSHPGTSKAVHKDLPKIRIDGDACDKTDGTAGGAIHSVQRGDAVIYSRNMEQICIELKKKNKNDGVLEQLIELTFIQRREKIQGSCSDTLAAIVDEFPFLKSNK